MDPEPAVIDAALVCFGRHGVARTTMADVAREAGVSRATLYRQVSSKDALVRATIQAEAKRLLALMQDATADVSDVAEYLAMVLFNLVRELEAHAVLSKVLETEPELVLPQLSVNAGAVVTLIAAAVGPRIREAVDAGRVQRTDVDATVDYVSRMLLSFAIQQGAEVDLSTLAGCRDVVDHEILH